MGSYKDFDNERSSEDAANEELRKLKKKYELLAKWRNYFNNEGEALSYARKLAMLERGDLIFVPGPGGRGWMKAVFIDYLLTPEISYIIFVTWLPDMGHIETGAVPLSFARLEEEE